MKTPKCNTTEPCIEDVTSEYEEYMKNQDTILEKDTEEAVLTMENAISDVCMENVVSSVCKENVISDFKMENMPSDVSKDIPKENSISESNKASDKISWPEPSSEEATPEPSCIKDNDYNQFFNFLDSVDSKEPTLAASPESNTSQMQNSLKSRKPFLQK